MRERRERYILLFGHLNFKGGRVLQEVMPRSFNLVLSRAQSYRKNSLLKEPHVLQDLWGVGSRKNIMQIKNQLLDIAYYVSLSLFFQREQIHINSICYRNVNGI